MFPKTCPECGAHVEASVEAIEVPFRGHAVEVSGVRHGRCAECGEVYIGAAEVEQLQKAAASEVRASQGLLQPEEIRALRVSLGLSQAAFEDLLGTGAKTVVRWEKGTVFQSATADRLMRLLREMPELRAVLESDAVCGAGRSSVPWARNC